MTKDKQNTGRLPDEWFSTLMALAMALTTAIILTLAIADVVHVETVTGCKVTRTYTDPKTDLRMLDSSCGRFEVLDSALDRDASARARWESVRPGSTYTFHTRGYRFEPLHAYPNIVRTTQEF